MRVPRNEPRTSRSLSPATIRSAFARTAHSRNMSSFGSRQPLIVPFSVTSIEPARNVFIRSLVSCGSRENFCVKIRKISDSISWHVARTSKSTARSSARLGVPYDFPKCRAETHTFVSNTTITGESGRVNWVAAAPLESPESTGEYLLRYNPADCTYPRLRPFHPELS